MRFFTRRPSRLTRRRFLNLEPLEDRTLLAGNLLITAEVPGETNYNLMQYTPQGTLVSSQKIPQSPTATEYQDARGLTVDPSENVHIFDGTFSPFLDTDSPRAQPPWSYQTTPNWGIVNNITYGEVASYKNFVFASNMQSQNGVSYGIVRFDTSGGSPVLLAPGYSFTQVTLGLDGQLYGVEEPFSDHTVVQVFNADTLAPVKTLTLKPKFSSDYLRSVAVDPSGNIYGAYWGGYVVQYDPNGNPTGASIQCMSSLGGGENLMNIALDTDGQIAVGGRGGEIYLTNESLTSVQTIQTGQWDTFVTFDHYIGVGTLQQFNDPGFEIPSVGTGTSAYQYNPTGAPWTYSASSGVAGNGSAFTVGNPKAPQGTQVAFIQQTGTISQAMSFPAGTYTISFEAAQRANYQASYQTIAVEIDGTVVGTIRPTGTSYSTYTTNAFTVTGGTHTISFVGLDPNGGDNTAFIDEASIAVPTSPPPGLPPATNAFNDPGFEVPSVGAGTSAYQYNPSGAPWTYSASSGVAGNGSAFTAGNPNAPQGMQVAFIQQTGTISQSVNFTAGSYTISFDAAQRANNQASSQTIEVEVDGTVVGIVKPTSASYALYITNSFTVTAGTHTVSFVGLDPNGGDNTAFLDNASIAAATSPPPPPSNQFSDPGFETPNVGLGTNAYIYNPSGAPWTYSDHSGVTGNGSAFTSGNPNAPEGTQVAFIQDTGTISQDVTFTAGTYIITFEAAQRGNYQASSQTIAVEIDGKVFGTYTPSSTSYSAFTVGPIAFSDGTFTIEFVGLDPNGGDNTAFLDEASISVAP